MANTFYTAYSVLKTYLDKHDYEIVNLSLINQAVDRVVIWVNAPDDEAPTHFVCLKISTTQFLIWGYKSDYTEVLHTSFSFADVNTPELQY